MVRIVTCSTSWRFHHKQGGRSYCYQFIDEETMWKEVSLLVPAHTAKKELKWDQQSKA